MTFLDEFNNYKEMHIERTPTNECYFQTDYISTDNKQTWNKLKDICPEIKSVNYNVGYVVMDDNTIKCSTSCSSWISQFHGSLESEIHMNYMD